MNRRSLAALALAALLPLLMAGAPRSALTEAPSSAPPARETLSRLADALDPSRRGAFTLRADSSLAARLDRIGLHHEARDPALAAAADPRIADLAVERAAALLERIERAPLLLPEEERGAFAPVRAHKRDLDGDGADDLAVLLAEPLGPGRGRFRGAWLVVIKSCEPGHPPLARKILSGAVFTAASLETVEMNRLSGFELVVKLAREDGRCRVAVVARTLRAERVEVLACFDSDPPHGAADLVDLNGDGYIEAIRYEAIRLRRGLFRFPAVLVFLDGELVPARRGFRDHYRAVAADLGARYETDAAGQDVDPDALGWRVRALELAGEHDEAIARARDLMRALGRPDARNSERLVALRETVAELKREKEALSRAAAVTVY